MTSLTQTIIGFTSIMSVVAFVLFIINHFGPPKGPKVDILQLSVEEFILKLLSDNRQLRELLRMREKEWENEG